MEWTHKWIRPSWYNELNFQNVISIQISLHLTYTIHPSDILLPLRTNCWTPLIHPKFQLSPQAKRVNPLLKFALPCSVQHVWKIWDKSKSLEKRSGFKPSSTSSYVILGWLLKLSEPQLEIGLMKKMLHLSVKHWATEKLSKNPIANNDIISLYLFVYASCLWFTFILHPLKSRVVLFTSVCLVSAILRKHENLVWEKHFQVCR